MWELISQYTHQIERLMHKRHDNFYLKKAPKKIYKTNISNRYHKILSFLLLYSSIYNIWRSEKMQVYNGNGGKFIFCVS